MGLKSLLKIGITNSFCSLCPILLLFTLSIVYNDNTFSNAFTVSYAFQFIGSVINMIVVNGHTIFEQKNGNKDFTQTYSGALLSLLVFATVIVCVYFNLDSLMLYYSLSVSEYSMAFIFAIVNIFIDYTVASLKTVKQYKDESALKFTLLFFLYKYILIVPCRIISRNPMLYVTIEIVTIFMWLLVILIKHCAKYGFSVNLRESFRYVRSALPQQAGMLVVYAIGISSVAADPVILASYNAVAMCSDTQWDILDSGVCTYTVKKTCENKLCKKDIWYSGLYAVILQMSSLFLITIFYLSNKNLSISYMLTMYILEMCQLSFYGIRYVYSSYMNVINPTATLSYISIVAYVLRIIVSLNIHSIYALSIGVFVGGIIGNTMYIMYYFSKYRKTNLAIS